MIINKKKLILNKKKLLKDDDLKILETFEEALPVIIDYSDDPDDIGFQDHPDFWNDPANDHD